jgi:hypothetical protein
VRSVRLVGMGPKLLVSDVSTREQAVLRWRLRVKGNTAVEFGVIPAELELSHTALHKCAAAAGGPHQRATGFCSQVRCGLLYVVLCGLRCCCIPLCNGLHVATGQCKRPHQPTPCHAAAASSLHCSPLADSQPCFPSTLPACRSPPAPCCPSRPRSCGAQCWMWWRAEGTLRCGVPAHLPAPPLYCSRAAGFQTMQLACSPGLAI